MKQVLSSREAAAYLGVSYWTVVKWRALKKGPPFKKWGGKSARARYQIADLDAFIADGSA